MSEALDNALNRFEFTTAASELWSFLWHELADWYVEISKESLLGRRGEPARRRSREVLLFVLERTLRQLHPFAPHVTEELWHAVPHEGEALAGARWPEAADVSVDPQAELEMAIVFDSIRTFRTLKTEARVSTQALPLGWILPAGVAERDLYSAQHDTIQRLARLANLEVSEPGGTRPRGAASAVTPVGEFFVAAPHGEREKANLVREKSKLQALLDRTRARLADSRFREQAPVDVVRETEVKVSELSDRLRRIEANLGSVEAENVP
jgi:valyl-tRNA synthetase